MLRRTILAAARSRRLKSVVTHAPVTRGLVRRFVAGEDVAAAVAAAGGLREAGLTVSLDHLGEDTTDREHAQAAVAAYADLLGRLHDEGLTAGGAVEVSVKLSALGQAVDPGLARHGAETICAAARAAGTTVTLDMEGSATTGATLEAVHALRADFPDLGAVVQAMLHRSEDDCRALDGPGSRVRLCKGAYDEPEQVAFREGEQVDAAYARCLGVLMRGQGYPMVATHDPALLELAADLAEETGRDPDSYEVQMLYGVRPDEQRRLTEEGTQVRVYVPYGTEWYGYLMRRMAERPANLAFFLRAISSRD